MNCALSPTSSCGNSARVAANDDIYDLEDLHTPEAPHVRRLKAPHLIHPAYFRASRNAKVVEILTDLWGTVRFDTGKLNMKSAGYGAPVEWHQDWAFYPHTNEDLAAVGIMIDDVDVENGPMMVVPGSHKGPIHDHHGPNGRFCGAMDPETCDIDLSRRVPCSARPGRSPSITSARCTARRRTSRAARAAFCCTSTAPPMPGHCSASRKASTKFNEQLIVGEPSLAPRLAPVPVRMPLPPAEHQGSIYENQRASGRRYFETAPAARIAAE